jgi:hypothetical protein
MELAIATILVSSNDGGWTIFDAMRTMQNRKQQNSCKAQATANGTRNLRRVKERKIPKDAPELRALHQTVGNLALQWEAWGGHAGTRCL